MNSAINYLLSIESRGIKLGLERTQFIMKSCGNPHANLPVIQVAGTNGKGSVCAILEKIFRDSGYKTGLFTSPHLVKVNERIRVNGKSIENEKIESFINQYKQVIENNNITFFECMTAISAWYFKNNNVDIAIMETGLGGKFDSVSICTPIATIITPISYDHMEILGKTLESIAIQKAGIMKKNIICISAKQKSTVKKTLKIEAKKTHTPLYFLNDHKKFKLNLNIPGNKQKENAKPVPGKSPSANGKKGETKKAKPKAALSPLGGIGGNIDRIICEGNVIIVNKKDKATATGEKAVYTALTELMVVTGNAKLRTKSGVLFGKVIEYNRRTGDLSAKAAVLINEGDPKKKPAPTDPKGK